MFQSASEFIRGLQQRGSSAVSDFQSAIHRGQVLNHVVLAEINYFQNEKVKDLNLYMKTLINEQIQFYERVNLLDNFLIFYRTFIYRLHQNYVMQP